MDPNALANLDPKLRETYERVMGTPTPASTQPGGEAAATPAAPPPPPADAPVQDAVATPIQPAMPATDSPMAHENPATVTVTQPLPSPAPMIPLGAKSGHSGLLKVLYVLGAALFFTIYVFFWASILKIQLPF